MAEVRVQARFPIAPVADGNVAVNTFHFVSPGVDYVNAVSAALAQVEDFYVLNPTGFNASVGSWMGAKIQRACELRAYDMALPPYARIPTIEPMTLPAPLDTSDVIPLEVACVLSYKGDPPNTRRRRGRIYIPGITNSWLTNGTASAPPRFGSGAGAPTLVLEAAAQRLATDIRTGDWAVRSMATGSAVYAVITSGYVDLEPDTQRRRGLKTATRLAWP